MTRATIAGGALVAALVVVVLALLLRPAPQPVVEPSAAQSAAIDPSAVAAAEAAAADHPGFLYARITDVDGAVFEGRLRLGRNQEAFWGDYFDGTKEDNPWAAHAALTQQGEERSPIEVFGFEIGGPDRSLNLRRPLMARFGDIARIDAGSDVRVTLKSGTSFRLDRSASGDIDDGVRVWDYRHGVVDLDGDRIRTIELLSSAPLVAADDRLHGTVRTLQGDFTGYIQWNRQDSVGADALDGRTADGELSVRYDTMRSIARHSRDSARVTLLDGRELVLSESREAGRGNLGIYVDDRRYGRVLVRWDAFDRVDFSPAGSGPAYDDFPPGRALPGSVSTRDGRRLTGRLAFDFDESETTETLDADLQGVTYNIPFGLIASIVPRGREGDGSRRATVILHGGEELHLERTGDLADTNAGMLIFADGRERPEYVPWTDVAQIDFDRAPAMYPPFAAPRTAATR